MRPRLLLLLAAAAAASKWPEPPDDAVDAYVRSWAAGGTARRCGDVGAHGDCRASWVFLNVGASSLLQRADAALVHCTVA